MIKAHLDKPVRVGLVRCERSVPREAQAKYDCVHQARQDYQLGPHEFNWTIMDLDDDPSTSTAEVAAGGTASSSQPGSAEPRYREGLTVIVCGSCNATRHRINAEMLATRDLVDAVTLRATLLAACYHMHCRLRPCSAAHWRPPAESTLPPAPGPDLHSRQYAWTRSDASGLPGLLRESLC